jgi:hypothetical protein
MLVPQEGCRQPREVERRTGAWRPPCPLIHPSAWKGNSPKSISSILHRCGQKDTLWLSEARLRREGDHNFWLPWIQIQDYECGPKRGCSGCVGVVRAGSEPGPLPRLRVVPANEVLSVRRRRDSNPRYPVERYNTLAGCRLQPLGHSSGSQQYIKDMLRLRAPASDPSPSRIRLWSLRR